MATEPIKRLQTKRRLVPADQRKRALFSCDRCKLRKTKCNRIQNNDLKYDNITPCLQCSKAGVACTTSIPRKKRFYGPIKNISLHYKCLLALVTGLFPETDVYSLEELIDLGRSFKFDMPSIDTPEEDIGLEKEDIEKDKVFNDDTRLMTFNSNKDEPSIAPNLSEKNEKNEKSEKNVKLQNESFVKQGTECEGDNVKPFGRPLTMVPTLPKLPPNIKIRTNLSYDCERLIMDRFGHTHFIGNFGTASLLNGLCDIIIKRSYNRKKPPTSTQDIRDSSVQTITSENAPLYQYPTHLYNLDAINIERFPLINLVGKEEAEIYVQIFFEKVHSYYFIFNKKKFFERYRIFWEEIEKNSDKNGSKTPRPLRLASSEICCVYMVWILGRRFQLYSNPNKVPENSSLDSELIDRFIDIIKLSLSDVVLTPTIDGIRLLILFSVYLSSIKVRESGYSLMQMAAIQAKSLGLHRKFIVNKFNAEKSDVMKRIMWSLCKIESTLCCSFGRASAIPWEEIDIDLPLIMDENDEHFKTYYFESIKLTRIIFEILDYKKRTQKEPLSLISIEKALVFKRKLETFWEGLPDNWKDYRSWPIKRYKPKLQIQYHYYFITLTLPMFLYIVNSQNYIIKADDPFLALLVCGIKSSFKTAEIVSYTDSKGFFNGTIYYDVFYSYNAIMVLTLTYILFKMSQTTKSKPTIDLDCLDKEYNINLSNILTSINLIRKLILNNLDKIDGTMKRMSDIIETLLEDLGIIHILVKEFNAKPSNVKKIEDKNESGNTSVSASIPGSYRRIKLQLNRPAGGKRKRNTKSESPKSIASITNVPVTKSAFQDGSTNRLKRISIDSTKIEHSNSAPAYIDDLAEDHGELNMNGVFTNTEDASMFNTLEESGDQNDVFLDYTGGGKNDETQNIKNSINTVLSSLTLDTDLMDALFGSELIDVENESFSQV